MSQEHFLNIGIPLLYETNTYIKESSQTYGPSDGTYDGISDGLGLGSPIGFADGDDDGFPDG